MLNRVCLLIALIALLGVIAIFAVLTARGEGAGYSIVTCFVIYLAALPVGMPVVTTAVLAIGARQMAKEKAIVSRSAGRCSTVFHASMPLVQPHIATLPEQTRVRMLGSIMQRATAV